MMDQNMRDFTIKAKNMVEESTYGLTAPFILENGVKIESMVRESILGKTDDNMKEDGKIT